MFSGLPSAVTQDSSHDSRVPRLNSIIDIYIVLHAFWCRSSSLLILSPGSLGEGLARRRGYFLLSSRGRGFHRKNMPPSIVAIPEAAAGVVNYFTPTNGTQKWSG